MNGRQRQTWAGLSRKLRWRWTVKRLLGRCFEAGCWRGWAVSAKIGPTPRGVVTTLAPHHLVSGQKVTMDGAAGAVTVTSPTAFHVTETLIELRYCYRHAAEVTKAVLPACDQATLEYASGYRTVPLNTEE